MENRNWMRRARSWVTPRPPRPSGEALLKAAEEGRSRRVKALLAAGTPPDEVRNHHLETPLWLAAHHGHSRVAKALLKAGADPLADDGTGITPIIRAAAGGHHTVIKHMAAIRPEVFQSESAAIALRRAVLASQVRAVRALLRAGTPVDARPRGRSPALFATTTDPACMKVLLEAGASPHEVDERGRTPLHYASLANNKKTVSMLLAVAADPELLDYEDRSPLDLTTDEAVRRLLTPQVMISSEDLASVGDGSGDMIPLAMLGPVL